MSTVGTVVLLSGGMDSAICLMWAKERWGNGAITALSVDYGQTHINELEAAKTIAALAEVTHQVSKVDIPNPAGRGESTWVPARNLVLIALAATYRPSRIILGACQSDEAGYPDCRQSFMVHAEMATGRALDDTGVKLICPLLHKSKEESVTMATTIPLAWEALALSVTCYKGTRCEVCPACVARSDGFLAAGKVDPAL